MTEINKIITRLSQLDEALKLIKEQSKKINEEIKEREEELIEYCRNQNIDMETATEGKYNLKPISGRRLKKN